MKQTTMNLGSRLAATKKTRGFRSCMMLCATASLLATMSSAPAAEDKSATEDGQKALVLDASYEKRPIVEAPLSPAGDKITATNRSLQMNGRSACVLKARNPFSNSSCASSARSSTASTSSVGTAEATALVKIHLNP